MNDNSSHGTIELHGSCYDHLLTDLLTLSDVEKEELNSEINILELEKANWYHNFYTTSRKSVIAI